MTAGSRAGALALVVVLLTPAPAGSGPAGAGSRPAPCTTSPEVVFQGRPLPSGMGETSGLAVSTRHPGWAWVVRDSSHPASVYAVRFRGRGGHVVREVPVRGAVNRDWEEIVYATNRDGTGRLYVVESGQSGRDRFVYKMGEPDPGGAAVIHGHRRYRYAFPGNRHFNVEAAFFYQSRLTLVTKTSPARVYRFEDRLSERGTNRLRFVGILRGSPRVSMARISPDGHALVVADHNWLYAYEAAGAEADLREFLVRPPAWKQRIADGDNVEAGDFFPGSTCHVMLAAESRNVYLALTEARR